jgi:hypothetical protein
VITLVAGRPTPAPYHSGRMWSPVHHQTFVAVGTAALILALAACGTESVVQSGPPTTGRAPASTAAVAAGQAEALQACQGWAAAGKGTGASQLTVHAAQAAAAGEGAQAAAAAPRWVPLAKAMEGSVHLPVAMVTPQQESEAAGDLATIHSQCARLGIAIAS